MTKEQLKQKLDQLHEDFLTKLQKRVNSEDCTAQDLKLAWEVLQDNNVMTADMRAAKAAGAGTPVTEEPPMTQNLPFRVTA